jgi:hypothetical protein
MSVLVIFFRLVPSFAYFSTLKMETICSSELLADRTARRYKPKDRSVQNQKDLPLNSVATSSPVV